MVDCRKCKYYKWYWKDVTELVIKRVFECNAHDNPIILKTIYRECKVFKELKD